MTEAEYMEQLAACNFNSESAVSKLVSSTHTNILFNEKVNEVQINNPLGAQNFFSGFFGTEVWPDGQGDDYISEYATDPYIPFTFSHFVRTSTSCDPNMSDACDANLCKVPEGGRGTLPTHHFYRWGFETERTCIAAVRSIRAFQYWSAKVIRNRMLIDEQVMNMFYVMAALKTAGHKIVMQGQRDANGNLSLRASTDPRNASGYGLYNYMQELFPAVTNVNDLCPITMQFLEGLARRYEMFPEGREVASGPRGKVFELWHPDDVYQEEVLRNPDYMKSLRYTMPNSQFMGYTLQPGDAEIIGNWKFKPMPWLPRFSMTSDGKVVSVQSHVNVEIEVGYEPLPNVEFLNAPIGLAMMVSGRQGVIFTRPTLSQSGDGTPILPIASSEPWQINNEYDATCNKYRNKPFSYKRYELGFGMRDPNAGTAFLFRRRVFAQQPISDCDLAPIFLVDSSEIECSLTSIGCNGARVRENDDITQPTVPLTMVECTSASCGNGEGGTFLYKLKVPRKTNNPDFNSLNCNCGDAVTLFVHGADGLLDKQIQGVIKDNSMGFPNAIYFVETTEELEVGQCIKYLACSDSTYLFANVESAWDANTPGFEDIGTGVWVVLDGPIGCSLVGDDVTVRYYNSSGVVLGTVNTTVAAIDAKKNKYKLAAAVNLKADFDAAFSGATAMGVSCQEDPNSSSSSN